MAFLYMMKLFTGDFDMIELLSFLIMMVLLGGHVYLSTRKKAVYGIVVPVFIAVSFYPVYKLIEPNGTAFFLLIGLYVIALGCCLGIWYNAEKISIARKNVYITIEEIAGNKNWYLCYCYYK